MSQPRLAVVGTGGHACVVVDAIEREGRCVVAGFLDAFADRGAEKHGYPVLGSPDEIARLSREFDFNAAFVAIGDNWIRGTLSERILCANPQLELVTVIHPSAVIARSVTIGAGSVVMAGAVVNPGCRLGAGSIVNTRASVDHDCVIGAFASIAPGAALAGRVEAGHHAAVGLGACVLETIVIGEHAVVGAGAVVTRDVPPGVVAYGNPARVIHTRRPDDPYLRPRTP